MVEDLEAAGDLLVAPLHKRREVRGSQESVLEDLAEDLPIAVLKFKGRGGDAGKAGASFLGLWCIHQAIITPSFPIPPSTIPGREGSSEPPLFLEVHVLARQSYYRSLRPKARKA